jgi:hypothetical protein
MANGTSTSHARLTFAEVLESPARHEAYLAEVAAWASDRVGGLAPELGLMTITGNTELSPTRQQVTRALLDEADWLAERLAAARAAERTWIAHMLVFSGLGQETAVLSEVHSELNPRLLHEDIVIEEFHQVSTSTNVRNRNYPAGPSPWPCFAMRALLSQHA